MSTNDSKLETLRAHMHAELAHSPKAQPWWLSAVMLLALNAALMVMAALVLRDRPAPPEAQTLRLMTSGALLLTIGGGSFFGLRPGGHAGRVAMMALAGLAAVLTVVTGAEGVARPFWSGMSCATMECLITLVPMSLSVFALSRFAFDALRTVVVGMSAAALGLFALHLHCANGAWSHLLMFHAVPWAGLILCVFFVRRSMHSKTFAP